MEQTRLAAEEESASSHSRADIAVVNGSANAVGIELMSEAEIGDDFVSVQDARFRSDNHLCRQRPEHLRSSAAPGVGRSICYFGQFAEPMKSRAALHPAKFWGAPDIGSPRLLEQKSQAAEKG
jgi:hypothetical protein